MKMSYLFSFRLGLLKNIQSVKLSVNLIVRAIFFYDRLKIILLLSSRSLFVKMLRGNDETEKNIYW